MGSGIGCDDSSLQMGFAKREEDVLAQRTAGGLEAKMGAGGWLGKALEGNAFWERKIASLREGVKKV